MKLFTLSILSFLILSCTSNSDQEKLIGKWEVIDAYKQNTPSKKENLVGFVVNINQDSIILSAQQEATRFTWTLMRNKLRIVNQKENIDLIVRVVKIEDQILIANVPIYGDTSVWTLKKWLTQK